MDEATVALTAMSLGLFAIFVGLFIWGLKSGQFKNIEEPKYRMLEDNDDGDSEEEK
jgi:cbb3-type cytochrome oxidase maturation protein